MNRYPLWKYIVIVVATLLALLYAAPNFFPEDPAIQVSPKNGLKLESNVLDQVKEALVTHNLNYLSVRLNQNSFVVRFPSTDIELKAQDVIKSILGENYVVALNLAPRTPGWLEAIGGHPMKLGLDLRGGVHFLLDVDTNAVIKARQEGDLNNMSSELRENKIRYVDISQQHLTSDKTEIQIEFPDAENLAKALDHLRSHFTDYTFVGPQASARFSLTAQLTPAAITAMTDYVVDQNMNILGNRVNDLGVSEAVVQRQGQNQISVDLPGVQDTARAREIVGNTATLRFQIVDTEGDAQSAASGSVPLGSQLYNYEGNPLLLKNRAILTGGSITYATVSTSEDGRPAVSVRLGGGGESLFSRATAENVGKPLATVYIETISETKLVHGKPVVVRQQKEKVINVATIKTALANNFEITGLESMNYAQNLALLLRSGALKAPIEIIQERIVGPTLGAENIHKGLVSLTMGAVAVMVFMLFYYRFFGVVANVALILNLVFIMAVLSLLGATLTLSGIAGIVLNVGMAVDANVLINERIREELRNGMSPQASIHAGYERAFSTIIDSNVTTLIVTMILFALGSGPVKSFAVTLTVGILTSMVTAIFFTRAIVNLVYGKRTVKGLSIGIKVSGENK